MKHIKTIIATALLAVMLLTVFAACAKNPLNNQEAEAPATVAPPESAGNVSLAPTPDVALPWYEYYVEYDDGAWKDYDYESSQSLPTIQEGAEATIVKLGETVTLPDGSEAAFKAYIDPEYLESNLSNEQNDVQMQLNLALEIGDERYELLATNDDFYHYYMLGINYAYALIWDVDVSSDTHEEEKMREVFFVVEAEGPGVLYPKIYFTDGSSRDISGKKILEVRDNNTLLMREDLFILGNCAMVSEYVYALHADLIKTPSLWLWQEEMAPEDMYLVTIAEFDLYLENESGEYEEGTLPVNTYFAITQTDRFKVYFKSRDGVEGYFDYFVPTHTINGVNEADLVGYDNGDGVVQLQYLP